MAAVINLWGDGRLCSPEATTGLAHVNPSILYMGLWVLAEMKMEKSTSGLQEFTVISGSRVVQTRESANLKTANTTLGVHQFTRLLRAVPKGGLLGLEPQI